MPPFLTLAIAFAQGISLIAAVPSARAPLPTIEANDNRRAAGTLAGNTLTVRLEARTGMWYPEGPQGRGVEVAAWSEPGKPLLAPGPLVRAKQGTSIHAILKNSLDRRITLLGFSASHAPGDSIMVEPGATREVTFVAGAPGTYFYAGRAALGPFGLRPGPDTQLGGAMVIDPRGAAPAPDRVFVISWWFVLDSTSKTGLERSTMAINGLSWPHTERIDMTQGDSARWRIVNLTEADHPMHLHGFYFQVRAKGDGIVDTMYARGDQRMAVTEVINPFQTMSLAWVPTRPGNWIFHCHYAGHLSDIASLDTYRGESEMKMNMAHSSDAPHQMFGLVLGLRVAPKGKQVADARVPRPIRLLVRQKSGVYGTHDGYAFVLGGTPAANDRNALPPAPGPMLVLKKGERVAVTIVNQSKERAAVHWHGIELESFPDGVPGWSGQDKEILPSVAPGDSIVVRFTPPRSGTFMYHSHFNEDQQITSGLYGSIVVTDDGKAPNGMTDRVMLFSSAGPTMNVVTGPSTATMLNGKVQQDTMELRAGTTYRFRLIDITGDVHTFVSLLDGDKPAMWRAVAKDGADLPASQATMRPAADLMLDPGEIYDFEFTPPKAGMFTLRFGPEDAPPEAGLPKKVNVAVRVR
jgi:FtsP/CotA-like multicopper oxidase with cupredoxin domain